MTPYAAPPRGRLFLGRSATVPGGFAWLLGRSGPDLGGFGVVLGGVGL
jgi:hypothetical protein